MTETGEEDAGGASNGYKWSPFGADKCRRGIAVTFGSGAVNDGEDDVLEVKELESVVEGDKDGDEEDEDEDEDEVTI